ncbi:CsiV family protein [Pseudomaricurvus sp. HS19]|uniref:CsiV family protein n=1 Tax=Pseudomaricurvus sp. HS19 TaxID=2692626 RepID=UPI00136923BE|nr:CsiV family protein [Pseudomaricurvus sp. HS19]MYM62133.1 hypothetical protein [Pseudomaricurvus sp. HS19]
MKKPDWRNSNRHSNALARLAINIFLLAPLCLLLPQAPAMAQETAPWYKVEVVLFKYLYPDENEAWRKDINLSYPINWVTLADPGQPGATNTPARTFITLPQEQLQLTKEAGHLARSRGMRVLLHTGWSQPVGNREEAPAVVIAAGEKFGDHSELEGNISVGVSRYLHVSTNLWLTRFAHNVGQNQEGEAWPQLPLRPDAAAEKYAQLYSRDTGSLWEDDASANQLLTLTEAEEQPYVPAQVALMQQSRRMRSKELHYIDHPLMGVLILIEPLESNPQ